MQKLIKSEKQTIKCGDLGLSTIIFMIIGIGSGIANLVGSAVSGAKNIEAASKRAPEVIPIFTNSVFTNSYKTSLY